MNYFYKKPGDWLWTPYTTGSLEDDLANGKIRSDWLFRPEGSATNYPLNALIAIERPKIPAPAELSDEAKSRNPLATALCYLLVGGQQTGPYTPEQVRSMWTNGQITAETLYWFDGLKEWFPARNFCASPVRTAVPSAQGSGGSRQALGGLLTVFGLVIAGYFFFAYDTTVETESHFIAGYGTVGGERVHNTGLMQNRLLGCIGGLALTAIGVVLVIVPQKPPTA